MDEEILAEVKKDISRNLGYESFNDLLEDNVLNKSSLIAWGLNHVINAIVKEYMEKTKKQL